MSSLADLSFGHKQAMCTASIFRHEHFIRLRRRELESSTLDQCLAGDPIALDVAIMLTNDNVQTLEVEIARELADEQRALDPEIVHEATGHRRTFVPGAVPSTENVHESAPEKLHELDGEAAAPNGESRHEMERTADM